MSRNFFLTGATGVVGLSILEQLSASDELSILVNQRIFKSNPIGVKNQFLGNITKPNLGLSEDEIASLQGIECIVHSAALTDFTASEEALSAINVQGLKHVKMLSERLNVPLIYISTAFVKVRNGHVYNNYEQSKMHAESSLTSDITIVRPSVIIGDSVRGIMPKKQGLHNMLKLATKEVIPVVPGDAATLVDVIPRDTVAKSILTIVKYKLKGEFWLTAGDNASTLGQMLTLGTNPDYFERYQIRFKPPKLINPETFERLIKPVFMPVLPKRFRRMFEETAIYLKYLNMTESFHSDLVRLGKYEGGPQPFEIIEVMAKNIAAFDLTLALAEQLVEKAAA